MPTPEAIYPLVTCGLFALAITGAHVVERIVVWCAERLFGGPDYHKLGAAILRREAQARRNLRTRR
jgi:hypothetical protein